MDSELDEELKSWLALFLALGPLLFWTLGEKDDLVLNLPFPFLLFNYSFSDFSESF